ncbi:MAG TPA: hypothetical protein DHW71_02225 [Gammaproteobacteria bacterium]|nr:hypothetical protein [Gammaproteobacteria bacterium]HCK91771.1 hypothetical protein [Gammaproteobacteria bacterium]
MSTHMNDTTFKKILDLLYLSTSCSAYWIECIQHIMPVINAKAGMIGGDHMSSGAHLGRIQYGYDTHFVKRLTKDLKLTDLWTKSLLEISPDHCISEQECNLDITQEDTQFFYSVLKSIDVKHTIAVLVKTDNNICIRFAFQRSASQGMYSAKEKECLNYVLPHLKRVVQLAATPSQFTQDMELKLQSLEASERALLIFNKNQTLVRISEGAVPLFEKGLCSFKNNTFILSHFKESIINSAIQNCLKSNILDTLPLDELYPDSKDAPISSISISRMHLSYDIFAVVEIKTSLALKYTGFTQLTATEKIILNHIAHGSTPDYIAHTLHKSPHTIRTHIKNIKMKLNASSAEELVVFGNTIGSQLTNTQVDIV